MVNVKCFIKVNVRMVVLRVYFNFKRVLSILPIIARFYIFSGLNRMKIGWKIELSWQVLTFLLIYNKEGHIETI